MKNMKTKLIHEVRAVKNKKELGYILKAQKISEKVLDDTLARIKLNSEIKKSGISELDLVNFIKKSFVMGNPFFIHTERIKKILFNN